MLHFALRKTKQSFITLQHPAKQIFTNTHTHAQTHTHTHTRTLTTKALNSVWRIGIYESQITAITEGSSSTCFLKIHRHNHKGRKEEDGSSPTDEDEKKKKQKREGGRLMKSNTHINTNEWLPSQPQKGNFSPMREGEKINKWTQNKLQTLNS